MSKGKIIVSIKDIPEVIECIENLQNELKNLKEIEESHRELNAELRRENIRLNNILNELEKLLEEKQKDFIINGEKLSYSIPVKITYSEVLNKLKELKGSNE